MLKYIQIIGLLVLLTSGFAQSIDTTQVTKNDAPNLYIDCTSCDMSYIRTEIDYVNYVIDRKDADVFIMITRQSTGSNGYEHTLTLEGHDEFSGMEDTLIYFTDQELSDDGIRRETLKQLKLGLVRYLAQTPLSKNLKITYKQKKVLEQPEDRWDYWVFKTSMNAWFRGQSTYKTANFHGNVSANRITESWKIRLDLYGNYSEDEYIYDDITYNSHSQGQSFNSLVVKSVSDHLSIGASSGARASSYSNLDLSLWLTPAVEYNIFPYSESTRREFSLKYTLGYKLNQYNEITIYDKSEESLLFQSLNIEYEIKQSWGSANLEVTGSQYLHDLSKNRLDVRSQLSLKLFKGFSFRLQGSYAMIHNQLSLPRGVATESEILLQRQELATQYNYWSSMGISYTFGSIYNNIVNPRF